MDILIGDKSEFAIELRFEPIASPSFGYVRLWLQGRYLGAYEDLAHLLVFLAGLKRLLSLEVEAGSEFLRSSQAFLAGVVRGAMPGGDRYRLGLGESFDDFAHLGFRQGDAIRFVWALYEAPFFDYPDYPRGVHSASVPVPMFERVLARFEQVLEERARG